MYRFFGKVKQGKKRGKDLGFPTANIKLHKKIPTGIYISRVSFEKKEYPALTFIGDAKTFGETEILSETYILDFEKNIYGKYLSVKLLEKIRENKKFESVEKLIKEMKEDTKKAREYFKKLLLVPLFRK